MAKQVASKVVLAVLALGPVAAVAGFFRDEFAHHPALTVAGLVVWEIIVLVGGLLGKVLGQLQDRWATQLADWLDALLRRTFSGYTRHYRYFLSRVHHDVDLRGLSTWGMHSLAMEDVFVDLSLMPELPYRVPTGAVGGTTNGKAHGTPRQSIWQLLERYPDAPLAVLGPPGSGKTTLLRHVTLALCGYQRQFNVARQWRRKLPVLLFLRQHAEAVIGNPDLTLVEAIRGTLHLTKAEPSGWLERQLDKGQCVVMFDGLDEVPRREDRALVMEWVHTQMQRYPRNRFILTSRPGGFKDPPLITATTVQVREFNDAQVRRFVYGWYRTVEERSTNRKDIGVTLQAEEGADQLLDQIYASSELLALAPNPLLLTMIASVHKYRAALPGSRAELYREICQVFLGKRQEAKQLALAPSIEQQLLVLRRLAFGMMVGRVRDISAEEAGVMIEPVLERISYTGEVSVFLREMEHSSGLLVERDAGVYSFAHLTFQEYLAALHIAEKLGMDFLVGQLPDPWWREVILFRLATADASPILQAILGTEDPGVELLSLADECLEQARDIDAATRRDVLDLLSWQEAADPEKRELIAHVLLRRKLRRVIRTSTGAFVCPEPVTKAEYAMFLCECESADNRRWLMDGIADGDPADPVVGVGPDATKAFIRWAEMLDVPVRLSEWGDLEPSDLQRVMAAPQLKFWMNPRSWGRRNPVPSDPDVTVLALASRHQPAAEGESLDRLLKEQLREDIVRVTSWHNHYLPLFFDSVGGWLIGDLSAFLIQRDGYHGSIEGWAHGVVGHFGGTFPEVLLRQLLLEPSSRPKRSLLHVDLLPQRYRAQLPGFLQVLRGEWRGGFYWQAPQWRTPCRPGIALLTGGSDEAAYLRSYLRIMAWEEVLKEVAPRKQEVNFTTWARPAVARATAIRRSYRQRPPGKSLEAMRSVSTRELAWQYLYEWRENGILPLAESILLARA